MLNSETERDPNAVYINAALSKDLKPEVYWVVGEKDGSFTLSEARQKAEILFLAAAIAEVEASMYRGVADIKTKLDEMPPETKGFGLRAMAERTALEARSQELAVKLTLMVREYRPALPPEIVVLFGKTMKQPLVEVYWYGDMKMQWDMDQVRGHAIGLLECAEGAESDAFFYWFFQERMEIPPQDAYPLIQEFLVFRQRTKLEDLLKQTPGEP